jgi:hypothetical protein
MNRINDGNDSEIKVKANSQDRWCLSIVATACSGSRSRAKYFHHMRGRIPPANERNLVYTYLFMCKSQFMLKDRLPVAEQLYLICKDIKILGQGLGEFVIIEISKWHDCGDERRRLRQTLDRSFAGEKWLAARSRDCTDSQGSLGSDI